MRSVLRALSSVLIISGLLLLVDAGLTVAWQEPVSALYARVTQDRLGGDLNKLEASGATPLERRVLQRLPGEGRRIAFLARSLKRRLHEGQAAGRIRIPAIDAKFVVVDGVEPASLRKGPGFYEDTPYPGVHGTVAIAGHRTTYLAPFRNIDDLKPGNTIVLDMPYARFTYTVERKQIVDPDALWILKKQHYDRLVLSACHPLYSAAKRIVVFARLATTEPKGAAVDG